MYKRPCSIITVFLIFAKMVSKDAQDLKVKSQRAARSKKIARRNGREQSRGGGGGHYGPPPPGAIRVKLALKVVLQAEIGMLCKVE